MSYPTDAPEIWYKGQRVIRTILVNLVVLVPAVNGLLPLVAQAFDADDIPASVYLWVNGVIVVILAVTGLLSRIIAIPAVNTWLTKLGAGSVPRRAGVAKDFDEDEPLFPGEGF